MKGTIVTIYQHTILLIIAQIMHAVQIIRQYVLHIKCRSIHQRTLQLI